MMKFKTLFEDDRDHLKTMPHDFLYAETNNTLRDHGTRISDHEWKTRIHGNRNSQEFQGLHGKLAAHGWALNEKQPRDAMEHNSAWSHPNGAKLTRFWRDPDGDVIKYHPPGSKGPLYK